MPNDESRDHDEVRRVVVPFLALVVLAATGCQSWTQWGHDARLTFFNPSEATITTANVGSLVVTWTADGPTTANSFVPLSVSSSMVIVAVNTELHGYSKSGTTGCGGVPKVCTPIWIASLPQPISAPAAIAGQTAYVASGSNDVANPGQLAAFDLSGTTGCTGTPTTCQPLWTAQASAYGSVTVAGGKVFVQDGVTDTLKVFDAAGVAGCGGAPKVCSPLWTSTAVVTLIGTPSVGGNLVYVGGEDGIFAFDVNGTTNCGGSPVVCAPMWHGAVGGNVRGGATVDGGSVYVPVYVRVDGSWARDRGALAVFDALGNTGCAGTPKECTPRWTANLSRRVAFTAPAVAHGSVFVGDSAGVHAFDASGTQGCVGSPKVCQPLWNTVVDPTREGLYQPAVAGDVLYAIGGLRTLLAFDARGGVGCAGAPASCAPLFQGDLRGGNVAEGNVVVIDGVVYGTAQSRVAQGPIAITAFRLP